AATEVVNPHAAVQQEFHRKGRNAGSLPPARLTARWISSSRATSSSERTMASVSVRARRIRFARATCAGGRLYVFFTVPLRGPYGQMAREYVTPSSRWNGSRG